MKRRRNIHIPFWRAVLILLMSITMIVLLYFGGRWLEKQLEKPETRGDYTQRYAYDGLLEYEGKTYRRRNDVVSILLMGIDNETETKIVQGSRNGGQADFLRLLVIDSGEKCISQIQIDRDTMTPITVLGVLGNQSGVRTAQISLSHGFGDGKEQSSMLTVGAVSNLLFGMPIDLYMSMNMDGISALNDMLGGVTVTLEDDFSALDAAMTQGSTVTLTGDQAEIYVRSRRNIGIGTNEQRMERQETYISKIVDLLDDRIAKDKEFIGTVYDGLLPYLTTNISRGRLINEVWAAREYERIAPVKPAGTHEVAADGFMQFHVDEEELQKMFIGLFYPELCWTRGD